MLRVLFFTFERKKNYRINVSMIKKKKKKMGDKSMEYKSEVTRENNEVIRKEGEKR